MNERDFHKMASPMARRLQNLVARGVVVLSNAATKMQTLQIKLLAGETADGIEHFEPYGYTSNPQAGAEHVTIFVDGDRSHGVTLVVADRRYRLQGLESGEVALHDDQGQKIHITRAGIVIDCAGKPLSIANAPSIKHDGVEIGKTHKHSGIQPGASNTGNPI